MRIIIAALIITVSLIYLLKNNSFQNLKNKITKDAFLDNFEILNSVKNDVTLKSLKFKNIQNLSEDQLINKLKIYQNKSLLDINIDIITSNLIDMDEIESVIIEKKLPNILEIEINETKPFAFWSYNSKKNVISENGNILNFQNFKYQELLLVKGFKANLKAKELTNIFNDYEHLNKRIISAQLIDEYRWNVLFKDNILVKLPYKDIGNTSKILNQIFSNNLNNLNNKRLIDLRVPGRIFYK